jgi:glutamate synthase domain-containing protein 1
MGLTRLKSRGVISPMIDPQTGYGKYDMNEIGYEILKTLATQDEKSKESNFSI